MLGLACLVGAGDITQASGGGDSAKKEDSPCEKQKSQACGDETSETESTEGSTKRDYTASENEPPKTGDPVLIPSGTYMENRLEIALRRAGTDFNIRRYTETGRTFARSGLGPQWDTTLQLRVEDNGSNGATVYLGGTQPVHFEKTGTDGNGNRTYADSGRAAFDLIEQNGKYQLDYDNGDQAYFNDANNAKSYVFESTKQYTWQYDGADRVTRVEYESTPVIDAHWDTNAERITKVESLKSDGSGGYTADRTINYSYDSQNRLTAVDGGCGSCGGSGSDRIYTYYSDDTIKEVKYADGDRQIKMLYNSADQVTKQYKGNGTNTAATYHYDNYGADGEYKYVDFTGNEQILYIDSNFRQTKQVWKNAGNVRSMWEKEYDYSNGAELTARRFATSIRNGVTRWHENTWSHDSDGNRATQIDYGATEQNGTYNRGPGVTVYRRAYAANGRVTSSINARGVEVTYAYNTNGRVVTKTRDAGGLDLQTTYAYGLSGQKTKQVNPDNTEISFVYDANGHLVTKTTDPGGLAIQRVTLRDANGRVTKRVEPDGDTTTMVYDAAGNLVTRTAPSDRQTVLSYDQRGNQVTRKTLRPDGTAARLTVNEYDALGRVTKRRRAYSIHGDGSGGINSASFAETTYHYNAIDQRTQIDRPDGTQVRRGYGLFANGQDQLQHVLRHDGANWVTKQRHQHDMVGRVTKRLDGNDNVAMHRFYDGHGRVTKRRQASGVGGYTEMVYDDLDRVTQRIQYNESDVAKAESRMVYDAAGRQVTQRQLADPDGTTGNGDRLTVMDHDAMGRVTERVRHLTSSTTATSTTTYDAAGRAITRNPNADQAKVAMHYDEDGNMTKRVQDPSGLSLTTELVYDNMDRRITTERPDDTHVVRKYDGLGQVTLTQRFPGDPSTTSAFAASGKHYHDALGLVTRTYQIADPGSRTSFDSADDPDQLSLYDYSKGGELTARADANDHKTEFAYDAQGRRVTTTDPAGNEQIMVYDQADRVITRIRNNSASGGDTFKVALEYDKLDRRTKTIREGPNGTFDDPQDAGYDDLVSTRSYDALGQITQTTDPAGMQVVKQYDGLGQVTRQKEDKGGVGRVTDRKYNRGGRLTRLTAWRDRDSSGDLTKAQHTDYVYNKAGAKTRVTYPDDKSGSGGDRGYVTFTYDDVMRLVTKEDQKGNQTITEYDKMGRKTKVTRGSKVNRFTYKPWGAIDTAKRGTSSNPDKTSKVTRSYNGLNRMTRESQAIEEDTARNVDYAYDLAGNVTETDYPGDTRIETTFTSLDQRNVLTKHNDGANTSEQIADFDYQGPRNRVDQLVYETGADDVTREHHYDGAGRLERLKYSQNNNTSLPNYAYSYDDAGNVLDQTFDNRSDDVEDYSYDSLHRLTKTVFGQREDAAKPKKRWTYDHLGNHQTQFITDDQGNTTTKEGEFNVVNEQTKRGSSGLTWDKTGNLTEDDGGQQYAYDRQNMLTRVEDASDNLLEEYKYDALGRRIVADDGTNEKRFYYTGQQIIEETDGSNVVQRSYVWGNYIDELLLYDNESSGNEYFALRHYNYNVVALTDDTGSVVERYDYNPYGQRFILDADYSDDTDGQSDVDLFIGHQGLYHDTKTGLVYNRNRMLHTQLRRFTQRDPLGYVDGANLYQYVSANPVIFGDPKGTMDYALGPGGGDPSPEPDNRFRREPARPCTVCHGRGPSGRRYGPPSSQFIPGTGEYSTPPWSDNWEDKWANTWVGPRTRRAGRRLADAAEMAATLGTGTTALVPPALRLYARYCDKGEGNVAGINVSVDAGAGLYGELGLQAVVHCDQCEVCFYLPVSGGGAAGVDVGADLNVGGIWGTNVDSPNDFSGFSFKGSAQGSVGPGLYGSWTTGSNITNQSSPLKGPHIWEAGGSLGPQLTGASASVSVQPGYVIKLGCISIQ